MFLLLVSREHENTRNKFCEATSVCRHYRKVA